MSKRLFRLLVLWVCTGLLLPTLARAQQDTTASAAQSSFVAGTYRYKGVAIWRLPDGTTFQGKVVLDVFVGLDADQTPSIQTQASFNFGVAADAVPVNHIFQGTLGRDRLGSLRATAVSGGSPNETSLVLDPGRLPLLFSKSLTVASGGVLATDGTQLTFRATLKKHFAP